MELQFSNRPGCWECQLRRKYKNPLFLYNTQEITQEDIDKAHQRDKKERADFQKDFYALLNEASKLQSQVESETILTFKDRVDRLYEKCAGLGGDFSVEKKGLHKLSELIMQAILSSGIQDTKIIDNLKREVIAREIHFSLLEHPIIAHLLHPNSPINENEIVPTLLTEEEVSLRAAMSLFSPEQQQILCNSAKELLTQLKSRGYDLPVAWMRLRVMEQPLYRPN
jgi:hypothetical protein